MLSLAIGLSLTSVLMMLSRKRKIENVAVKSNKWRNMRYNNGNDGGHEASTRRSRDNKKL